jgi:dihydroorotase
MERAMTPLVLENVRIFDPGSGIDASHRTVVIEGDRITDLDARGPRTGTLIDCGGRLLIPGLIDLRAHLCEPGFTRRGDIANAVKSAASGGFTTIVAMPTTSPTVDRAEVVGLIKERAAAAQSTHVLPAGALSVGREGKRLAEMAKLLEAGCVCFTDGDQSVKDSQLLRYALETAGDLGTLVITHAEDESLSLGGVMHEGLVSARLGLAGSPGAAEVVGVARDLAIAELTHARLHVGHVSTAAACDLIRQAKRRGSRVTAEVSPLHLVLTDRATLGYDTYAKISPPLRPQSDVDAMVMALADGTLDAVATDHNPQIDLDKNKEFDHAASGAIGFESALAVMLMLVHQKKLTLERAIAVMTRGPANVLGRLDIGRIREGGPADLVLVDPELRWKLDKNSIVSRSTNTPLIDHEFTGRAVLTIAAGRIAHRL